MSSLKTAKDFGLLPPLSQIYATLRLFLSQARCGDSSAQTLNRILLVLEVTSFMPILNALSEVELDQLLPILVNRLTRLRVEITELPALYRLWVKKDLPQLLHVVSCEVTQSEVLSNTRCRLKSHCYLHLLGKFLPRLEVLNVHARVTAPFPRNLITLRGLLLRQKVSQTLLNQICANCPHLQQLLLRNESKSLLDMKNLQKCFKLKDLHVPLMVHSPLAICQLANLENLSMQRLHLWPGMDWVATIQEIINAKHNELRSLSFDGSWLAGTLDLSVLQLKYCWALQELLLSNCKMADQFEEPELPFSCQRLGFRNCRIHRLVRYFKKNPHVTLLELHGCQLLAGSQQILENLMTQRQNLPSLNPLQVRFSQSTPLRMEITHWSSKMRQYCQKWMHVTEQHSDGLTWEQPIGTISMIFGRPVNYMPDLDIHLPNVPEPPHTTHEDSKCLRCECLVQEITFSG